MRKNKIRTIVEYENHFSNFIKQQPEKVQNKIFKIIEILEILEFIPEQYLKSIKGTKGLYEVRIRLGNNIWRVFCFLDNDCIVILLNGFTKKSQRTPNREIEKAERLMKQYHLEKRNK